MNNPYELCPPDNFYCPYCGVQVPDKKVSESLVYPNMTHLECKTCGEVEIHNSPPPALSWAKVARVDGAKLEWFCRQLRKAAITPRRLIADACKTDVYVYGHKLKAAWGILLPVIDLPEDDESFVFDPKNPKRDEEDCSCAPADYGAGGEAECGWCLVRKAISKALIAVR